MNEEIKAVADRLIGLREIMDVSVEQAAKVCGISEEQYKTYESGNIDIPVGILQSMSKEYGIDLAITDVGDRYVIEEMKKSGHNLGGEQSGHMIFLDYNTTGDGTLSSLIVSKIVKEEGKTLSEQSALMTTYPQVLINVDVKNEVKNKFMENDEIRTEIEKLEKLMAGTGRVLIRPSGTQPLVRVMLEGKDEGQIRELAQELADLIKAKLS